MYKIEHFLHMYIDIKVGVAVAFTPLPLQGASLSPLIFTVWVEIFECGRVADGSGSVMPASSLNAFVLRHGTERVLSVTIELEQEVMVLPEGFSMGDCDERDALLLHVLLLLFLSHAGFRGEAVRGRRIHIRRSHWLRPASLHQGRRLSMRL